MRRTCRHCVWALGERRIRAARNMMHGVSHQVNDPLLHHVYNQEADENETQPATKIMQDKRARPNRTSIVPSPRVHGFRPIPTLPLSSLLTSGSSAENADSSPPPPARTPPRGLPPRKTAVVGETGRPPPPPPERPASRPPAAATPAGEGASPSVAPPPVRVNTEVPPPPPPAAAPLTVAGRLLRVAAVSRAPLPLLALAAASFALP